MPDAALRSALVEFFAAPPITGIQHWYRDEPWFIQGGTWNLADNGGWGALAYVHIDRAQESRITIPVETGQKRIDYTVSLLIAYQYLIPSQVPENGEDSWVGPLDQIVDAVKDRIRSDPTAGTGQAGAVFQFGQGDNDIRHERDLPRRTNGVIHNWTRLEVDVVEIITA